MTEAPLWVDAEVVLPQPNLECAHRIALGPRRDTTLSCTQSAIEANVDYAVTLLLSSDSSTVASGSRVDGVLHFDWRDVEAFEDRLMAVRPPQSYKGIAMPDSSMERGTLSVALDGIAYRTKARSLSVSASSIVGVGIPEPAAGQPQFLVVEYSEGGGTRSIRFTSARPLDLVRIHGSLDCLMRRKAQTK